jgi:hypothetical protein
MMHGWKVGWVEDWMVGLLPGPLLCSGNRDVTVYVLYGIWEGDVRAGGFGQVDVIVYNPLNRCGWTLR